MKKILIAIALFSIATFARAATLSVVVDPARVSSAQAFRVDVALDTQGDSVNAFQTKIVFPPDGFSLQEFNDGASPINFWIEPPHEIASGVISFSGVIPGGFNGTASSVVGFILTPLKSGAGTISIESARLLKNDGLGTPVTVATSDAEVEVVASGANASGVAQPGPSIAFTTPEKFAPIISRDPSIYGGKYFLAFSTTDKGSGIDHYEVAEVPAGTSPGPATQWQVASSPYLLQDQSLSSDIYVRAVNHAGDSLTVKVSAENRPSWPSHGWLVSVLAAIGILILCFVLILYRRRRRQ